MASKVFPATTSENFNLSSVISNKLCSDLDSKIVSSSKQVLLERISFHQATKPDTQYELLKKKYPPLNSKNNTNEGKAVITAKSSEICGSLPQPKIELYPEDKVSLKWKQARRVGPGLHNMGNTCFLNSVLQVLTYVPPLVNYMISQEHSKECRNVGFCMMCELQTHIARTLQHTQQDAIRPMSIIQKLKFIAKHLRFGHQEDSHEFLCYVLDGLQRSCLAGLPEKLDRYSKETTLIHRIFGGYFLSKVKCLKCHHQSNTYDPLLSVMLDIKNAPSVMQGFQKFIKGDLLDGDNMYMCPRCNKKVTAVKNSAIFKAPNVLIIQLKRFSYGHFVNGKITKHVQYNETINIRPFMTDKQAPPVIYKLIGVLVHAGFSCNSGHYYCYIKAANGNWYHMNDASVRQVGLGTVLQQQAYMLFYIKNHQADTKKVVQTPQNSPMQATKQPTSSTSKPTLIRTSDIGVPVKRPTVASTSSGTTSSRTQAAQGCEIRSKLSFTLQNRHQIIKSHQPTCDVLKKPDKKYSEDKTGTSAEQKLAPKEALSATAISSNQECSKPLKTKTYKEQLTLTLKPLVNYPSSPSSSSSYQKTPPDSPISAPRTSVAELPHTTKEGIPPGKDESVADKVMKTDIAKKDFVPMVVTQKKKNKIPAESHSEQPAMEDDKSSVNSTFTKWKITEKSTLSPAYGPMSPQPQSITVLPPFPRRIKENTQVRSISGGWSVTEKVHPEYGLELPERQHAGWKVSEQHGQNEYSETGDDQKSKLYKSDKKHKKVKRGYEELLANEIEEKPTSKTRKKHKKNKKCKHDKDYEELRSSDSGKYRRQKSSGDLESTRKSRDDNSDDQPEHERREKHKKHKSSYDGKDNQKRKRKYLDDYDVEKQGKCKSYGNESYAKKFKNEYSNDQVVKKHRKYDSYPDEEEGSKKKLDNGHSKYTVIRHTESEKHRKHKSDSKFESKTKCGDHQDPESRERGKKSVDSRKVMCLEKEDGHSKYSKIVNCSFSSERTIFAKSEKEKFDPNKSEKILSWDGCESETLQLINEEGRKKKEDRNWDDDYDQGTLKRSKNPKETGRKSDHNGNLFQNEHDKKKGFKEHHSGGWHSPSNHHKPIFKPHFSKHKHSSKGYEKLK